MAAMYSWRSRVERSPEPAAALDPGWYKQLATHRHQPYPRQWPRRPEDRLRVTVHCGGLAFATPDELRWLEVLLSFAPTRIDAAATPAVEGSPCRGALSQLDSIRYGDAFDDPFVGRAIEVSLGGADTFTTLLDGENYLPRRVLPPSSTGADREAVRAAWNDMGAHEALHRDVFLTAHPSLLRCRGTVGAWRKVWILSVDETLDYFETVAKGEGEYFPDRVVNTKRLAYYWERTDELAPSLSRVSRLVTRWHRNDGDTILQFLVSLRTRLAYLMEARDHIGYLYYTSVGRDANDAALYHLSYFFLLAAAAFDNVAWILQHVYNLGLDRRNVGLHSKEFRKAIGQPFQPVCDSHDKLLRVFQEPRHSVAHRLLMWAIGFGDSQAHAGANLVETDDKLAEAIGPVDSGCVGQPYSSWGLRRVGPVALLEPYRFTSAALREILNLVEDFFPLLLADDTLGWEMPAGPEGSREPRWGFAIPYFRPIV